MTTYEMCALALGARYLAGITAAQLAALDHDALAASVTHVRRTTGGGTTDWVLSPGATQARRVVRDELSI